MRKVKIIAPALAILLLICCMLAGCTDNNNHYVPPTVDSDWVRSTDNTDDINVSALLAGIGEDWLKKVAQDYTDETGIKVNVYFDKSLDSSITVSMNTGRNLDDLYLTNNTYDWVKWAAQGKIESLEDMMDLSYPNETVSDGSSNTLRKKIKENVYDLGRYNDETYIVQLTYSPTGFVYNEDILKQLGYDSFPSTWTELLKLCNDINEAGLKNKNGATVRPMSWGGAVYDLNDTFKALWAQSDPEAYEEFFAYSGTQPDEKAWVSDSRLKALEALYDLLDPVDGTSQNSVEGLLGSTNVESEVAFLNGLSVFCPTGSWFESEVSSALGNADFTYKLAPVPTIEGGESVVNINIPTEYFFVPSGAANVEGAKDFLRYMMCERNLQMMHETNQTPLAFYYDTSSLELSDWGNQVLDLLESGTNVIAASDSAYYRVGALSARFNGLEPYTLMSRGAVTKDSLRESVLVVEYNQRVTQWKDWVTMVDDVSGS